MSLSQRFFTTLPALPAGSAPVTIRLDVAGGAYTFRLEALSGESASDVDVSSVAPVRSRPVGDGPSRKSGKEVSSTSRRSPTRPVLDAAVTEATDEISIKALARQAGWAVSDLHAEAKRQREAGAGPLAAARLLGRGGYVSSSSAMEWLQEHAAVQHQSPALNAQGEQEDSSRGAEDSTKQPDGSRLRRTSRRTRAAR